MTRQLVIYTTAVMTTLLALVVLWQFHIVVVYVVISLMLAAAFRPLVNHLVGRGVLRRIAWILLYVVVLGSFGFLIFFSSEVAISEIQVLGRTVSVQDKWILPGWLVGSSFESTLVAWLPPPSKLFEAVTGSKGQFVLPAILGITQDIGSVGSATVIILFLSLYWSTSQVHFERLWLSLLPSEQRTQARGIWRTIEPDIGAYIRSQAIHSLLAGVLFGLGFWLLGSPYPALLAMIGALACLVPVVGAVLAVFLPLLVGLLTNVQLGLFTALYALVILIALVIWVKPRLFSRRWDNPILTVFLIIALADAFGLVGIIVAPPVSVVCQILWNRLVSHRLASGAAVQISDLKDRQERLWTVIRAMDGPTLPLVSSSMTRLTQLIVKAEPVLQEILPIESSGQSLPIAAHNDQES